MDARPLNHDQFFDYMIEVEHSDLTAAADTEQNFEICTPPAGSHALFVGHKTITQFADASDGAFTASDISIGIAADVDKFLNGTDINAGGTPVDYSGPTACTADYEFDGDTAVVLNFGGDTSALTSGKALANLDSGKVRAFVKILRAEDI